MMKSAKIKEVPEVKVIPCRIHCEAIAPKTINVSLKIVRNENVEGFNFIKFGNTNSRLFYFMCNNGHST